MGQHSTGPKDLFFCEIPEMAPWSFFSFFFGPWSRGHLALLFLFFFFSEREIEGSSGTRVRCGLVFTAKHGGGLAGNHGPAGAA
jgi:hypothetical protein